VVEIEGGEVKLQEIWYCIRNLSEVYSDHCRKVKSAVQADVLLEELQGLGFEWRLGSPAHDIGIALEMADQFGVEIHRGMCYADCRASIPKERWKYPLNTEIKSGRYGSFLEEQDPDEIESIYGYGGDVPEAVSRCLIHARIAGVI